MNNNALGKEAAFSLSGGSSSNVSYNLGFNKSTDEEVMPSNGKGIEQLKIHGIPKIIDSNKDFPFITVSPQCPLEFDWRENKMQDKVITMLENFIKCFTILEND